MVRSQLHTCCVRIRWGRKLVDEFVRSRRTRQSLGKRTGLSVSRFMRQLRSTGDIALTVSAGIGMAGYSDF